MKYPSITILTGTLNPDLKTFTSVLRSIQKQKYKGSITHLVLDGGSKNGSIELAKKYGCIVKIFPNDKDEGSNRMYPSLPYITGDISLILESDNILPTLTWLDEIVEPFYDKDIFAVFPAYNTYYPSMDILTRYSALFGSPDPTLYYLGKSDKIPIFQKKYDKGTILKETEGYYKILFTKDTLPTVGDNGFAVRTLILKDMIKKYRTFYHTDVFAQLVTKGFDTYGITKNAIIHTTKPGIINQIKRRMDVKKHFTDDMKGKRVYLVFNPDSKKDRIHILLFILYSITFIQPFMLSIRGYIYKRDIAWFLHPLMCICMVFGYGWTELEKRFKNIIWQKN